MKTTFKTSIRKDGAFFAHDPAKTFRGNAHEMMQAIAREGAIDVRGQLKIGDAGRRPIKRLGDHVSDHVAGELRKRPTGANYTAVVFVRNRGFTPTEAISLMAAASRVERAVHAFRRTFGRIRRSRAVNEGELLKGLN